MAWERDTVEGKLLTSWRRISRKSETEGESCRKINISRPCPR